MVVRSRRRLLLGCSAALALPACAVATGPVAAEPAFALGVASGQPRADGAVLWTRLTGAALPPSVDVAWEVAHDPGFARIAAHGSETAVAADAHSVHAEPAGLDPDRWYWYRFRALGQASPAARTRTAPAPDAEVAKLDFVVASCQRWDVGHYAAWRHAAAEGADLVLFVGDYIYEYAGTPRSVRPTGERDPVRTLGDYRRRHALHKSDPALRAAHAAVPWLVVWDDHEVDNDYAGLQASTLEPGFAARREAAYRAYWEHMPLPKTARPVGGEARLYGRLDWGRLARLIVVDDRQWRDPQACLKPAPSVPVVRAGDCGELADPRRSLLGMAQERWLADAWEMARPWNLLAQQTLMARLVGTAAGGPDARIWTDGWDGYAPARRRLLETVAARRVPGAVVFGGDLHANVVADLKPDFDDPRSPVVATEFSGTAITSTTSIRFDALLPLNPHVRHASAEQRGYLRGSLTAQSLRVQWRGVADATDPASAIATAAAFHVDARRPGAERDV